MNKPLKIFACDHRSLNGKAWPYPFQRIGTGFSNDCVLKDINGDSICTEKNNEFLSEYTAIWWLWKHLKELNISQYIGFVHYRRFFTIAVPNYGMFPINNQPADLDEQIVKKIIPNEDQLLQLLESKQLNGIFPQRFPDYSYVRKCNNIVDLMFEESKMIQLGFDKDCCQMMFDVLFKHMSQFFSQKILELVRHELNTYHFNMFIIDLDHFEIYSQILDKTVSEITKELDQKKDLLLHSRALSYAIERFSSCVFLAMIGNGGAFAEMPILMIDNKEKLK